jgi:integrase-like protein
MGTRGGAYEDLVDRDGRAQPAGVSRDTIYTGELRNARIGGRRSIRPKHEWIDARLERHARGAVATRECAWRFGSWTRSRGTHDTSTRNEASEARWWSTRRAAVYVRAGPKEIYKAVRADAAGLKGLQLRDLRHEAASRFDEAGVLTTDVSKFLGHHSLTTTTRYLNTTSRRLRLALLRVEQAREKPRVLQILAKSPRNPAITQTTANRRPPLASHCLRRV